MFSRVRLNEERAANAIIKIARLLYSRFEIANSPKLPGELKFADSLNFKRDGKRGLERGTVFTEFRLPLAKRPEKPLVKT